MNTTQFNNHVNNNHSSEVIFEFITTKELRDVFVSKKQGLLAQFNDTCFSSVELENATKEALISMYSLFFTAPSTPTKEVKKLIRKELNKKGSHLGTVKAALETKYPNVEWSEYREFAKEVEQKKFAKVEPQIRASVRYQ